MNHQEQLEQLINDMAPSRLLKEKRAWLETNVSFLHRRIERLKRVKAKIEKIKKPTRKQKTFLNRYKSRIIRLTQVHQHREYLLFLARAKQKARP